jgi:Zn-dependent peptidase ImmA (M78 family)
MNDNNRLVQQGIMLKKIRDEFSRSAEEVASYLGFGNRQSVYDLEAGRRDLKAYEALRLAEYYGVSTEMLLSDSPSDSAVVYWRGKPDAHAEKLLRTRLERYSRLESHAGKSSESAMPAFSLSGDSSFEFVGKTAESVAGLLNLGQYPARVLEETIRHKWNVVVFHVPLETGSGACIRQKGISAILLNSGDVWWRRNFSLGHELFHLLFTDCGSVDPDRIETLANVFAGNLLMPSDTFSSDVRRIIKEDKVKYFDLMSLAKEYMVSTEALMWRMCSLDLIPRESVEGFKSDPSLKALDREVHGEILREDPSLPTHMVMLAYGVYLSGKISVGKLAEYLETTVGQLKGVLKSHGIDPFAQYYEATLSHSWR